MPDPTIAAALDRLVGTTLPVVADRLRALGDVDEKAIAMFERIMATNLPEVAQPVDDGSVFVLTGDIPAMWLRDSGAQLRPYVLLCADDPELQDILIGVLKRQLAFLIGDPYANSFVAAGSVSHHAADETEAGPDVWERKYEVDSLCFPIELAYRLWRMTARADVVTGDLRAAIDAILTLWEVEQDHEARSTYRFQRHDGPPSDTLVRAGAGRMTVPTGMTWSAFRPSDDACELGFNVPGNMFASVCLGYVVELATEVFDDPELAARATRLRGEIDSGIESHAVVRHPVHGEIFAYEVDGAGASLVMDDANMPSLLSAPLSGWLAADDPRYLATRAALLSDANPFFHRAEFAEGIGSPHTPVGYVWPIGIAVRGLTAVSRDEKLRSLASLVATTGGTDRMHESFDPSDPAAYTRPWFSWADAMFCELVLDLGGVDFSTE